MTAPALPFGTPTAAATRRGILLMLLAILLFTAMDAQAKGLVARYPAPMVIWARFMGQILFVLIWLGPAGTRAALHTRRPFSHLARAACQFGATSFFFLSLGHVGLAEATALADINPVLITLGAALFLGERLGPRRLAAVGVAMVGAMIVIRPGAGVFTPAALLPLACAVCYAANALLTRHIGRQEGPETAMLIAALFGTLVAGLALPLVAVPVALGDLPLFLLIGALGAGAQLALIRAFSLAEAATLAPLGYVGLIFATLWGIVLYGEWPDRWTVLGALVIAGAGVYVWHRETRAARARR